jgi:hypothetical protein
MQNFDHDLMIAEQSRLESDEELLFKLQRRDAAVLLHDVYSLILAAVEKNDLLRYAVEEELLPKLLEAKGRVDGHCPSLYQRINVHPPARAVSCQCWRCTCSDFDEPFCDPFAEEA